MALFKKSDSDVTALKAELKELRKFKQNSEARSQSTSKIKVFLMKIWAGPELSKSLEDWMTAKELGDTDKTISSTANLLAAVLRRVMRVSFVFIFFASIPILLIIWQNIIMERQNQSLIKQIEAQRAASASQQVTEYITLLLSDKEREVSAAEGFLASDLVNRDIAVERLVALMKSGNPKVQCSGLNALSRIVESSSKLTLSDVFSPDGSENVEIRDLQCSSPDFSGVDFGPITFLDVGFPNSNFKSADLSEAEFQGSNLRHSDLSEAYLCAGEKRCVSFLEDTDLSFSNLTFTDQSKNVFREGLILKGAQLSFSQTHGASADDKKGFLGTKQVTSKTLSVPKIPQNNLIASGVCYETSFSQCYLYHKNRDLERLSVQQLNSLRQNNCPINLDGPIVLTSLASCKDLGLEVRW